ncbi:MAG: hypothetical protein PT941_04855, partial [Bacillales bacterium]|nr:hypothetical protein [Bacillales bacterium]
MKKIRLIALIVFGFIISIFSGASNWVLINSTDSKSASSDSTHTVTVYYKTVEDAYVWTGVTEEPIQIGETVNLNGDSSSEAKKYYDKGGVGTIFDESDIITDTTNNLKYKTYYKIISRDSSWF